MIRKTVWFEERHIKQILKRSKQFTSESAYMRDLIDADKAGTLK